MIFSVTRKLRDSNRIAQLLVMTPTMRISEGSKLLQEISLVTSREPLERFLDATQRMQQLHVRRTELQSMPFQSRWEAGAELGSIVLCAAGGGLSVSLHFSFLSLFGVAFLIYRRSTASIRRRQEAQTELAEVNVLIREAAVNLTTAEENLKKSVLATS